MISAYIPEEEKYGINVKNFKYYSINNSLIYKHLTGPFAEYIVNYIPKGIA